jgi:hypothetical protein
MDASTSVALGAELFWQPIIQTEIEKTADINKMVFFINVLFRIRLFVSFIN